MLKRLALSCVALLIAVGGAMAADLMPVLASHWLSTLIISGAVLGMLWLVARQLRKPAAQGAGDALPLWTTTLAGASAESIARLEALARDNEHLQQELLARGEQLKQVTDGVRQRREAQQVRRETA
ncbi:hypothetical protein ABT392_21480 [Paucibacter sp. JuS9]|uniref:hypothetical protein n=1 Tax=Roseateles TaxID=93681 RepID=UPI002FE65A47